DDVVTKIPRWTFEKFPDADPTLTVQMKSVGETMAIGRTFKESLQKALRGLEIGHFGLGGGSKDLWGTDRQPSTEEIRRKLATPNADRIFYLRYAIKARMSLEEIQQLTGIDPWFLRNLRDLVAIEDRLREYERMADVPDDLLRLAKQSGYSDHQLAGWWGATEMDIREHRKQRGIVATFKQVDTCAAEFEAYTPYYYSTYESEDETPARKRFVVDGSGLIDADDRPVEGREHIVKTSINHQPSTLNQKRIMILGGGPNRIGQGIEFDYCCCHASFAMRDLGIE